MNDTTIIDRHHNMPPEPLPTMLSAEALREVLPVRHAELLARFNAIMANGMPSIVEDDDDQKRVSEAVAIIKSLRTTMERTRQDEKQPFDAAAGAVHSFHKLRIDKLDELVRQAEKVSKDYLRKKEDAERARRLEEQRRKDEEARIAREAAERAQREAAEAQRKKDEAEAAARRQAADEAARAAALRQAAELGAEMPPPAPPAPAPAPSITTEEQRLIDDAAEKARQAALASADAAHAGAAASAKPADLVRTRDDIGGMATAAKVWTYDPESVDRSTVDLEALRAYLPMDGIHQAIRGKIKADARVDSTVAPVIGGVIVFEDRKVNFRGRA